MILSTFPIIQSTKAIFFLETFWRIFLNTVTSFSNLKYYSYLLLWNILRNFLNPLISFLNLKLPFSLKHLEAFSFIPLPLPQIQSTKAIYFPRNNLRNFLNVVTSSLNLKYLSYLLTLKHFWNSIIGFVTGKILTRYLQKCK